MKKRTLKIQARCQQRTQRSIVIPELTLKGRWLQQAGFNPDSRVEVIEEDGRLIIQPTA